MTGEAGVKKQVGRKVKFLDATVCPMTANCGCHQSAADSNDY
jgi:hypothetical protein